MVNGEYWRRLSGKRISVYAAKVAAVALFVWLTNTGFMQRIDLLMEQGRWITLVGFVGVWGLSLTALLAAAFQGNRWLRFGWGAAIAVTTAVGYVYHKASGSEFGVLDAQSLWNARHEATRAAEFYTADLYWLVAVTMVGFIVFALPPGTDGRSQQQWSVPDVAAVIRVNDPTRSEALWTQILGIASMAAGRAPSMMKARLFCTRPAMIGEPSPPAPITAPIMAVPILMITDMRTPAEITWAARGISTLKSVWVLLIPMPKAASSRC